MASLVDEMVYIYTSGPCDQLNACVTFIFAATKIGALGTYCCNFSHKSI